MYQVIVVGAGPAGAYLAYLLARQGVDVLLLEKERFPRYKPCGGGVSPKVVKLVDFDISPVIEDTVHTLVFTHRLARPLTVASSQPIVYMVSREKFDALLMERARQAGVEVLEGAKINKIQVTNQEVSVRAGGKEWRGLVLVGADGAFSTVARTLGLAGRKQTAVALEQEIALPSERLTPYRGVVKVDYGLVPSGYTWVFPKANHLSLGVGTIVPQQKGLRSLLGELLAVENLADLASASTVRGWAIPFSPHPRDLHCGRALVVGDAAVLADAFTGEGIYAALLSARLAAEVISEEIGRLEPDLRRYTTLVQEKMGPELANAFRVTRWFYPFSSQVHRILHRRQTLATDLMQVVAGEMTYTQFFKSFRQQLPLAWLPGHGPEKRNFPSNELSR